MLQIRNPEKTAIDCSTKLLQSPIVLGGVGKVVQIDESIFNHKTKVNLEIILIMQ